MIREKSGFWDSIDATANTPGDERVFDAHEITIPFEYLVTDGVQTGGSSLQVFPGEYDYSSKIVPGLAWIKGRWYLLFDDGTGGLAELVMLHDAPLQYSRIDRVVLRYDANYTLAGRKINAAVVKGIEAAAPVAPELVRNDEIYELSLARVLIKPGEPVILEADILDERFDGELCGIAGFAPEPNLQPKVDEFLARLNAFYSDVQDDALGLYDGFAAQLNALLQELADGGAPASMITTTPPDERENWVNAQAYLQGLASEKAERTVELTGTLLGANWTGDGPYEQTIAMPGVTAGPPKTKGNLGVADTLGIEHYPAVAAAQIVQTVCGEGQITVTAIGDKPEIDIPVVLHILG